jgi:hypothetical protein
MTKMDKAHRLQLAVQSCCRACCHTEPRPCGLCRATVAPETLPVPTQPIRRTYKRVCYLECTVNNLAQAGAL